MPIRIPIARTADDSSFFDLRITVDNILCTLEFRWNVRMGSWFLAILDAEGVNVFQCGIRLVADWLLSRDLVDRSPPGLFAIIDTGAPFGRGEDPDFDGLGGRWQMYYYTAAELGL